MAADPKFKVPEVPERPVPPYWVRLTQDQLEERAFARNIQAEFDHEWNCSVLVYDGITFFATGRAA